jgi:tRNA A-37 threonylcarbamoyl transferase component Bud32
MIGSLRPGDVVRQKYRLEQVIGEGGMAVVIAAWHLRLDQRVALKFLRPETARHPDAVQRFFREAQAVSKMEGSHVPRVIDVDALDDGLPFIAMEFLEGSDLSSVARDGRPLDPAVAAGYVRQACEAITEAHGLGIIHRDLKPANLFLAKKRSGEEAIKVLDFGISKLLEDTGITAGATAMGSAEYMSPEQMTSSRDVDVRTDIWSLGVTLYELVTARSPFHADGVGAVCMMVMTKDPARPRSLRPDLPAALEAVILRCLDKDPARRYATAAELAAALLPFTVAAPAQAAAPTFLAPASTASPWQAPPPASAPEPRPAAPPRSGGLTVLVGGVLGALAVAVVIVAFVAGRGDGGKPAAIETKGRYRLDAATLFDAQAKLTWQRTPGPGAMTWSAAKAYCARAGNGYRLPDRSELTGLLDVTRAEPPLDPQNFPTTPADAFWTASPAPDSAGGAWVVHFFSARVQPSPPGVPNRVRCVR